MGRLPGSKVLTPVPRAAGSDRRQGPGTGALGASLAHEQGEAILELRATGMCPWLKPFPPTASPIFTLSTVYDLEGTRTEQTKRRAISSPPPPVSSLVKVKDTQRQAVQERLF